jgi:ribosomal protein L3 glutamine methyltransferase
MTVDECIAECAAQLNQAQVALGQGTLRYEDEAAWLVLWALKKPLDTDTSEIKSPLTEQETRAVWDLLEQRLQTRRPLAYLTQEAWLQGVSFYVDERCLIPRSLIAEVIAHGTADAWLHPDSHALAVANINIQRHGLQQRIHTQLSDGLAKASGPYELIACNPPYVNANSMASLPAEFLAEPPLALAGGVDGMDFIRELLKQLPRYMSAEAVLWLEIGHEIHHFQRAFPLLEVTYLSTSAGDEQVLLITREALLT